MCRSPSGQSWGTECGTPGLEKNPERSGSTPMCTQEWFACLFPRPVVLLVVLCLSPVHMWTHTPQVDPLDTCVHICTEHRCLFTTACSRLLVASLLLEVAASSCCVEAISTPSRGRAWRLVWQKCHELGVGTVPSLPGISNVSPWALNSWEGGRHSVNFWECSKDVTRLYWTANGKTQCH